MTHNPSALFNEAGGSRPKAFFTIPSVVSHDADSGRPVVQDVFSRLLQDNIVYITGANAVGPHLADTVTAAMLHLYYDKIKPAIEKGSTDPKDKTIKIMINSPGGSIHDGLQIYDLMQLLKSEGVIIETHSTGIAMSMGSVLLVAGSEGHRYAWPSSEIMLHKLSAGGRGNADQLDISNEEYQYLNDRLMHLFKAHTNLTDEQLDAIFHGEDYFLYGEEAKAYGIIDDVMYPTNDAKVSKMLKDENMRHWDGDEKAVKPKKMRLTRPGSNDNSAPSDVVAPRPNAPGI